MRLTLQVCAAALAAYIVVALGPARGHNVPNSEHNRRHAITQAFCPTARSCELGRQALRIAYCESGPNLWNYAHNGPVPFTKDEVTYAGMFQFGPFARARYGFSWNPWKQARAARRYYNDASWSPWSCA